MREFILEIENLKVKYDKQWVLKDISFCVKKGETIGLIGANGAGKSTTIKTILGLIPYTCGRIVIDGCDIKQRETGVNSKISYIPEMPVLYDQFTLIEHMRFIAMLHNIDRKTFEQKAAQLIELFDMNGKEHDFASTFSKGMRQKIMVMCAFLYDPVLYLVDEPFLGLDPKAIKNLIKLLNAKKQGGASVLISTHILDIAQKMCDRFVIINNGCVLATGSLSELNYQLGLNNADLIDIYDRLVELNEK